MVLRAVKMRVERRGVVLGQRRRCVCVCVVWSGTVCLPELRIYSELIYRLAAKLSGVCRRQRYSLHICGWIARVGAAGVLWGWPGGGAAT